MNAIASHAINALPLQARDLSKSYGERSVLNHVSLEVAPGTVLGLIGRNGSGKTTLLRCLLGLIEPNGGEAFVFGAPSLRMGDAIKERLSYVPQNPEALGWMRADAMLKFISRFYPRWDKDYADAMLTRWKLPCDVRISKLSPGERQRLALIRALAPCPDLLVLDEPAASLDPVARRDLLRQIVERASESGTTVLISSHIVSDLERIASHVAFLHEGRMLLHESLDDLKERCVRIIVPEGMMPQPSSRIAGELARRTLADGSVCLVLERGEGSEWPALAHAPGVTRDTLGLEDLFIEIAQ
jgi:ABC-2 type transport system ATP-binding protein